MWNVRSAYSTSQPLEFTELLVIPFDKLGRSCGQITEQACSSVIRPGCEIQLCRWRGRRVAIAGADISRTDRPDPIDRERLSACVLQEALKFSCGKVVRCDVAARLCLSGTCELPDEQVMAEPAEIERGERHAPWGI